MNDVHDVVNGLSMPSELELPTEIVEGAAQAEEAIQEAHRFWLTITRVGLPTPTMGCDSICFTEPCAECTPLVRSLSLAQEEHVSLDDHQFMVHLNVCGPFKSYRDLLAILNEDGLAPMLGRAMTSRGVEGVVVHSTRIYWRVGTKRYGWWIREDRTQFARVVLRHVLLQPPSPTPSPTTLSFLASIPTRFRAACGQRF